jgi:hypothetical protein
MGVEENFVPLSASNFFLIRTECHYLPADQADRLIRGKKYLLDTTSSLNQEDCFADLHMGWNEEGLYLFCQVKIPFKDVFYPEVRRGDSLELFIDTRDIKESRFNTKFCHHFFFLPQEIDRVKAGEITRFRGEEIRNLADPKDLHLHSEIQKKGYTLKIFIPSQCLYGYDPEQCDHLGFTYRINRWGGSPQHFSRVSEEFAFEQQPSLWSSVSLIHENSSQRKSQEKRS